VFKKWDSFLLLQQQYTIFSIEFAIVDCNNRPKQLN